MATDRDASRIAVVRGSAPTTAPGARSIAPRVRPPESVTTRHGQESAVREGTA